MKTERPVWWLDLAFDSNGDRVLEAGEVSPTEAYGDDVNIIYDEATDTAYTVVIENDEASCIIVADTLDQFEPEEL